MNQLDSVIANREIYIQEREAKIRNLKSELAAAASDSLRYEILGNLLDKYKPFNTDSAFYYSLQRERIAKKIGNPVYIANARMNQANVLNAVGMYQEASSLINAISSKELPDYLLPYYFYIKRTLAGNLAEFSAFSPLRAQYNALTNSYRDSLMKVNDPESLAFVISKADQYNAFAQYDKAVETMTEYVNTHELSEHEKAICAWTLAQSYEHLNDLPKLKEQLIISSIGDMKAAVREYVSLRQLALLLYKEGDLERAYKFMNIAVDDATKSNARQRIVELNASYPELTGIYIDKIKKQQDSLVQALWAITILSVILIGAFIYLWKQMKVISKSRKELADANDRLNNLNSELKKSNEKLKEANEKLNCANKEITEASRQKDNLNSQLRQSNDKLSSANKEIAENSHLKEIYIGRYMDQCLSYIDSLDTYRKTLLKLASAGKLGDIKDKLKSTEIVDERLRDFYDTFDSTFLKLFPTFVEDFNNLLLPEESIIPKKKGTLNTELRIFALIRLGILSDSDKIAKFLRYSLTTIYNYRTKVRNKAKGDRAKLESEVMKIGLADNSGNDN